MLTASAFLFFSVASSLWLRGKVVVAAMFFVLGVLVFIPGSSNLYINFQLLQGSKTIPPL